MYKKKTLRLQMISGGRVERRHVFFLTLSMLCFLGVSTGNLLLFFIVCFLLIMFCIDEHSILPLF
jgi:hypothetical protein